MCFVKMNRSYSSMEMDENFYDPKISRDVSVQFNIWMKPQNWLKVKRNGNAHVAFVWHYFYGPTVKFRFYCIFLMLLIEYGIFQANSLCFTNISMRLIEL